MRGGMDPAGEFIAAMLGIGLGSMPFGRRYHAAPEKPAKKCSLPSCQTMTRHNGGYCCADHCREHRAILRTSNPSFSDGRTADGK